MASHPSGRMFVLSTFMTCDTSTWHTCATAGTNATNCSPVNAGASPLPSSADAMVPPVAITKIFFICTPSPK